MRSRLGHTFVGLFLLVSAGAVVISVVHYSSSLSALEHAEAGLQQSASRAERIFELRAREERVHLQRRPPQDVVALVHNALSDAGLPARHFSGVRGRSAGATPPGTRDRESRYRVQAMSVQLRDLSLGDLGAFLGAWQEGQTVWTVTEITLSRTVSSRGRVDPEAILSDRYDVDLIISALYVENSP